MKIAGKWIIIFAVFCALLMTHVSAGTKYMSGSPQLSAYISGTNEFSPGSDATLTIVIENSGLNEFKMIQSGFIDRDDLPNTAKLLMVSLSAGDAPLIVKSDPQMVGDLKGGNTVTSSFNIKILSDARSGTYTLPVDIRYTYLQYAEQYGTDAIQYYYKATNANVPLIIKIKPDISIDVLSAQSDHLNVGTEGYLNLKIKNTGYEDGTKAVIKVIRNGNSPVIPTDSSVYVGDFPSGSTVDCRYKVSVAKDAERSIYPVDVAVVYVNKDGDTVTSRSDTIGVPVSGKIDFAIISAPAEMNPGNKKVISVEYKNTGDTAVYSAQGRISAVNPFTSNDDIAYLGEIKPGESVTASYEMSVDRAATVKEYGLDSEIRYRDALDNSYISDTMKVRVNVTAQTGISALLSNPIMVSVIIAVIIGIVYAVYKFRKKGI
ncbi:MAG: S-layer protein [Methanoregula sp.]|nr:MAG: S-layer protein [Methanoregula sp.]